MCLGRPGKLHAYKENASATALDDLFTCNTCGVLSLFRNGVWSSMFTPVNQQRTGVLSLGTLILWGPLAPFYLGDGPSCPPLWCCTSHQSSQPDAPSIEGEQPGM